MHLQLRLKTRLNLNYERVRAIYVSKPNCAGCGLCALLRLVPGIKQQRVGTYRNIMPNHSRAPAPSALRRCSDLEGGLCLSPAGSCVVRQKTSLLLLEENMVEHPQAYVQDRACSPTHTPTHPPTHPHTHTHTRRQKYSGMHLTWIYT